LHPWVPCNKKHGGRTTGETGNIPAFPARWVTAYFVLSPARPGLFATVFAKTLSRLARRHQPLGRQDHTTSPSALATLVSRSRCVHRIPHHVRDDREPPLVSGETGGVLHRFSIP
jgi:hypothetical protein